MSLCHYSIVRDPYCAACTHHDLCTDPRRAVPRDTQPCPVAPEATIPLAVLDRVLDVLGRWREAGHDP